MPLPKKNVAFSFDVSLVDSANRPQFRANPTLAAGDVKVSIDEGAFANLTTLPTVSPASGRNVKVSLSAAEMNGDRICIQFVDAAGSEWDDLIVEINTSANTVEDVIADTDDIQTRLPAALVGGRMDASVGAYQTGLTPLQPTVAGRTLDVSTGGEAGIDWANIGSPTSAVNLSATNIDVDQVVASVSGAVGSVTAGVTVNSMSAGVITGASIATAAFTSDKFSGDTGFKALRIGTAQAGGASTITLDAGASTTNDQYNNRRIVLTGGTGSGQVNTIADYVGATKVATVDVPWITAPDNTTNFAILPDTSPFDHRRSDHAISGSFGEGVASVQGNVTGNVAGSVGSVTGAVGSVTAGVTVATNNDKTGYALTSAERNAIADAWLDRADAVETGVTPRLALRYTASILVGQLSGAQTASEVFKAIANSGTTRVTVTADSSGNRTGVALS